MLLIAAVRGIVALNVGALRNSISASRVEGQEAALRSQNAELQLLVAQRSGFGRIKPSGPVRHGQAQPPRNDYLRLHPLKHAARPPATSAGRAPAGRAAKRAP